MAGNPIGGTGDVTAAYAGPGLTGGGDTGDLTLSVDQGYLDSFYLRTNGSNGGPFARLDIDNFFQGNQNIAGFTQMSGGFQASAASGITLDVPNTSVLYVGNYDTTGQNRAITAEVFTEPSIAIVAAAHTSTGGTGGAFGSDGDNGNGVYAANHHPTGGGSAVFAEVFSPNAVPGRFRNNAAGVIIEGTNGTWPPVFSVAGDGTVYAFDFVSSSSLRYKTNVVQLDGALETIENLRPVSFDWKSTGKRDIGLIAEEVAKVVPDAVAFDAEGAQGVDYSSLTALLIEAVQEQQQQIRDLRQQLQEALKSRN